MLAAANAGAFFRLTSAMTGSASAAAPQKMLSSEKNVDKATVKVIKSPPDLITSVNVYNMPQVIYDGIVEEHPDFSQKQIADYYVENQEELNLFYKFAMNE